jgi:hypothetical protein
MTDLSSRVKKGSIFYLLRKKTDDEEVVYNSPRYISSGTMDNYSATLGPIPLVELSKRVPLCFSQVPQLLWHTSEWTSRGGKESSPRLGDMVICVEPGSPLSVSGGFYTDCDPDDAYKAHEFVTWSSVNGNLYGFVFCSSTHIHSDIINHVLNKLNNDNT